MKNSAIRENIRELIKSNQKVNDAKKAKTAKLSGKSEATASYDYTTLTEKAPIFSPDTYKVSATSTPSDKVYMGICYEKEKPPFWCFVDSVLLPYSSFNKTDAETIMFTYQFFTTANKLLSYILNAYKQAYPLIENENKQRFQEAVRNRIIKMIIFIITRHFHFLNNRLAIRLASFFETGLIGEHQEKRTYLIELLKFRITKNLMRDIAIGTMTSEITLDVFAHITPSSMTQQLLTMIQCSKCSVPKIHQSTVQPKFSGDQALRAAAQFGIQPQYFHPLFQNLLQKGCIVEVKKDNNFMLSWYTLSYTPYKIDVIPLPFDIASINFWTIRPLELAKQLTVYSFRLYSEIKMEHLVDSVLERNKVPKYRVFSFFEKIQAWVLTEVSQAPSLKKKADAIARFIELAMNLYQLYNFDCVFSVCLALQLNPISEEKMKKVWNELPKEALEKFRLLEKTTSFYGNYRLFRELYSKTKYPKIPFSVIISKDLTAISENKDSFLLGKARTNSLNGRSDKNARKHQRLTEKSKENELPAYLDLQTSDQQLQNLEPKALETLKQKRAENPTAAQPARQTARESRSMSTELAKSSERQPVASVRGKLPCSPQMASTGSSVKSNFQQLGIELRQSAPQPSPQLGRPRGQCPMLSDLSDAKDEANTKSRPTSLDQTTTDLLSFVQPQLKTNAELDKLLSDVFLHQTQAPGALHSKQSLGSYQSSSQSGGRGTVASEPSAPALGAAQESQVMKESESLIQSIQEAMKSYQLSFDFHNENESSDEESDDENRKSESFKDAEQLLKELGIKEDVVLNTILGTKELNDGTERTDHTETTEPSERSESTGHAGSSEPAAPAASSPARPIRSSWTSSKRPGQSSAPRTFLLAKRGTRAKPARREFEVRGINKHKMIVLAEILKQIYDCQQHTYNLLPVDHIQRYIDSELPIVSKEIVVRMAQRM